MKNIPGLPLFGFPIGLCATLAVAQVAPASKPDSGAVEAVVLSAFTVSDSKDVGYTATNTLAGTRLNTALKDVGTSITVVTKEFLTDIAANDSGTLLPYTVGTEIGGTDGNFAGGAITDRRPDQAGDLPMGSGRSMFPGGREH